MSKTGRNKTKASLAALSKQISDDFYLLMNSKDEEGWLEMIFAKRLLKMIRHDSILDMWPTKNLFQFSLRCHHITAIWFGFRMMVLAFSHSLQIAGRAQWLNLSVRWCSIHLEYLVTRSRLRSRVGRTSE